MFRVIIAGGRDFDDYQLLKATMDKLLCNITDEITVVCGQAKGADTLGEQYAMEKGYTIDYYPAQWKLYGKRAGYLRNEQMAQNADALAAFWNGESRGTKNTIELAKRYGKEVSRSDIPTMVANAQKDACGLTNPRKMTDAAVQQLYEIAF